MADVLDFCLSGDLYSISPGSRFTFRGAKLYSSRLGKVLSFFVYALTITATYYFSQNLLYKTSGQITLSEVITPNPEAFPLNKDTFFFAFALQNSSNNFLAFIDEQIYTIEMKLRIKEGNNFSYKSLSIGECDESDYPSDPDLLYYFMSNSVKGYYCIKNWTDLELLGYWDSVFFKELQLLVHPCINGSGNNITCKSPEELDVIFGDGNGYFGSFLSSGVVDPDNYETPIKYTPMNFYTRISLKTYVFIELSLQHNQILTDSGFLLPNIYEKKGISKSGERQSVTVDPNGVVFELLIRLDRIKKVFSRKYDKVQDVLANVGGVFNFLLIFGSVAFKFFIEFEMVTKISQDIFDLNGSLAPSKPKIAQNPSLRLVSKGNGRKEISTSSSVSKGFIFNVKSQFENWKRKVKFLGLAKQQIDKKMDISFIISKLLEIDKIKYMMFDPNQLLLFDLIPKPKIFSKKLGSPSTNDRLKSFHKKLLNSTLNMSDFLMHHKSEKISTSIKEVLMKNAKTSFDGRFIQLLKDADVINQNFIEFNKNTENVEKVMR